jgi:hypothetical protein
MRKTLGLKSKSYFLLEKGLIDCFLENATWFEVQAFLCLKMFDNENSFLSFEDVFAKKLFSYFERGFGLIFEKEIRRKLCV